LSNSSNKTAFTTKDTCATTNSSQQKSCEWSAANFSFSWHATKKAEDREEVDDSLLDFAPNHRDIMIGHFNASLPPSFKAVNSKKRKTNNNDTNNKRTTKKGKSDKKKEKRKKLMAESIVKNKEQCVDFKLNHNEKWEQFAGKKLDHQAKLNGTIMCACWQQKLL
jgi:hypothetical protein